MPKVTQAMTDFSGGISTGTSPKNIEDNQLVEAENFIPMGKGSLRQVMGESNIATSGSQAEMPRGRFSNIFAFQSDQEVTIGITQNSNADTFSAEVVQVGRKLNFKIYLGEFLCPASTTPDSTIRTFGFKMHDLDSDTDTIIDITQSGGPVSVETDIMLSSYEQIGLGTTLGVSELLLNSLNLQGLNNTPKYSASRDTDINITEAVMDISNGNEASIYDGDTDKYDFNGINVDILAISGGTWVKKTGPSSGAFKTSIIPPGYGILKNDTAVACWVYKPFTTVVDDIYKASLDIKDFANEASKLQMSISHDTEWNSDFEIDGDNGVEELKVVNFVANSTTSYLHIRADNATSGQTNQITNVQITDLAEFVVGHFIKVEFEYFGERNLVLVPENNSFHNYAISMADLTTMQVPTTPSVYPDAFIDTSSDFQLGAKNGVDDFGIWSRNSWGGYTGVPYDGAFYRVKINIPNPPRYEVGLYTFKLNIYNAVDQLTMDSYTITYSVNVDDTVESIIMGIQSKIEQVQLDATDKMDYFVKSDFENYPNNLIILYQDIETIKAYGFTVTDISKSIVEAIPANIDNNTIAVGQTGSEVSLYSLEADKWLNYTIQLYTGVGTAPDTEFSFFSADGFMRVCDPFFNANNTPRWFGYLNLDKVYGQEVKLTTTSGWFDAEDVSPTPDPVDAHSLLGTGIAWEWDGTDMTLTDSTTSLDINDGLNLYSIKVTGTDLVGLWEDNDYIEFFYIYIYEGGAISPLKSMGSPMLTEENESYGFQIKMGTGMMGYADNYNKNNRLKGIEIYFRSKNGVDTINYWLFAEIDLNKGWRTWAINGWNAFILEPGKHYRTQNGAPTTYTLSDAFVYQSPPKFQTYKDRYYGLDPDNVSTGFDSAGVGWRTATVYNRRAYYGNVKIKDESGEIKYFPDGIIKTPKNMFDIVSISNLIEAVINDGDEIIALNIAGDKLCQFKRNSLVIMEIKLLDDGQQFEQIHRIIPYVGIMTDSAVCKTPMGLFWISKSGAYIYNGEKLEKLTESQSGDIINKQEWNDSITDKAHIGYDAYWNQVHICSNNENNTHSYIYDLGTGAWSKGLNLFGDSYKSGFVNDREGHICWAEEFDSSVVQPDNPALSIAQDESNAPSDGQGIVE